MAYNHDLARRIEEAFLRFEIDYEIKKMFGGAAFMVKDKMCVGVMQDQLMARIGPKHYDAALKKTGVHEMNFTGRPMKGYVFVDYDQLTQDQSLDEWITLCLRFNPFAKTSKRKTK
jgi:TfoX/Sxy family transcriptional regulator of competence genes